MTELEIAAEYPRSGAIIFDDISVCRGKHFLDSISGKEVFPITIQFSNELSDKKLQQLTALAKWVQDKKDGDSE